MGHELIEKIAIAPFHDGQHRRITVLEPGGRNLTKLASVLPEVETFAAQLAPEDGAYWLHVIAQTASEYYGQNRNGDHWGIEGLSYLPPGWTGQPSIDRELAKNVRYGCATFYGAHAFSHHKNRRPDEAIGRVELVAWNPHQFWAELVVRLDIERTSQSSVKWVLDRIKRGAPFDVSMGAKVPFDMAITGDMTTYRRAWRDFNPTAHRSPADAILAEHRRLKAVDGIGIRGLSITRDDYLPELKTDMGKTLESGIQLGVRNDFAQYFDLSIVSVGADKVAKLIKKLASAEMPSVRRFFFQHADPIGFRIDEAYRMTKAASAKGAAVSKEGDIDKETGPAFDEKSISLLAANDPDLPEPVLRFLKEHPNFDRVLSTLSGLGIVLKPKEYEIVSAGRDAPFVDDRLFTPEIAARLLAIVRRRSVLGPLAAYRIANLQETSAPAAEVGSDARYRAYRDRITGMLDGGPDRIVEGNKDLWHTIGRSSVPLVSPVTRRYFNTAFLPPVAPA